MCLPFQKILRDTLIQHYGEDREAQTIDGEEYLKKALISSELHTEWKIFHQFFSKHPEEDMKLATAERISDKCDVSVNVSKSDSEHPSN